MMNKKRVVVMVALVLCCLGMVFAQGAREALEKRGETIFVTPEGYRIGKATVAPEPEAIEADRSYSLVGYHYTFCLSGKTLAFKYLDYKTAEAIVKVAPEYVELFDYVSEAQVEKIKAALQGILDVPSSIEKTEPGVITLTYVRNLTDSQFVEFVDKAAMLIYNTIY